MRMVVAMSGGVDSSVVAALLAEAGHEVVGITLQLYDHGAAVGRAGAGCAGQDILDARRVADHVGIAHDVLDMEARLRSAVIEDFAEAYARGLTAHAVQRRSEHQKNAAPRAGRPKPCQAAEAHPAALAALRTA
jgi:tRNA-specific 2-thiouridylase